PHCRTRGTLAPGIGLAGGGIATMVAGYGVRPPNTRPTVGKGPKATHSLHEGPRGKGTGPEPNRPCRARRRTFWNAGRWPDVQAEAGVNETGVRNGAFGADKFGFDGLAAVHWNLAEPLLYEFAIAANEAQLAYGGALCADTGVHTGRSPKDKFIVR